MKSIFTDKTKTPTITDLKVALGNTFYLWKTLSEYAYKAYPKYKDSWVFTNEKYGWSYKISDNKRVLIYFLPRDKYFKVAFVFGNKASDEILNSDISEEIKSEIKNAKVYAEGRGIRLEVKNNVQVNDIKKLITIKISN